MAKRILYTLAFTLVACYAQAQNSIGVNTDSPNPNAALDIKPVSGQVQGVLIPRLNSVDRNGMSLNNADNGLMVFDSDLGNLFIWFNGLWLPVAIEGFSPVFTDGLTLLGDGSSTDLAVNVGIGPDQIVQLDGSGLLPPIDGSQLTGVTATIGAGSVTTTEIADGTIAGADIAGSTISDANINDVAFAKITGVPANLDLDDTDDLTTADVGVAPGNIVTLDGSSRLPAVDGSLLTNITPTIVAGSVTTTEIADGTIAGADIAGSTISDANINDVAFAKITGVPANLDVDDTDDLTTADVGVAPGNIVALDGSSRLPAVDGSLLTNITPVLTSGSVTTAEVFDGTIATVDIAANAITDAKINDVDFSKITNTPANLDLDDTDDLTTADVGVAPGNIVALDGSSRLPAVDGSLLTNVATPLNSGNGVTVAGPNVDLGGTLSATSTITTAAGSDLLINGAGTLDVDALADFSSQATFSDINVTGGAISGAILTQNDNAFFLADEGTGNQASFELSALSVAQSYSLPDASGQIALTSDLAGAGLWADNAGDINYMTGKVGIGTITPAADLHIYNNGLDQAAALSIDPQGTQVNQVSALILHTLGDGATAIDAAGTNGWMMLGFGNSFSDASRQNELSFSNFMASAENSAILHLEPNGKIGMGTGDPLVTLDIDASDAIRIPRGSTAQAPTGAGAANGMLRYNNDNFKFEGYSQGSWQNFGGDIWADNAGDINYSGGLVGVGTLSPMSTLQVDEALSLSGFQNSVEAITGSFIGGDLSVDRTDAVNNALKRISGAPGSFMFFENTGEIKFLHAGPGAANSTLNISADVESSLSLYTDQSAEFEGQVRFNSNEAIALPVGDNVQRDAIAVPIDGMMRYSNEPGVEGFEGRILGNWEPIGGVSGLTLPYSDIFTSGAVPLFELINDNPGGGTTARFANSTNIDPAVQVVTDLGPGGTGLVGGIALSGYDDGSTLRNVSRITSNIVNGAAGSFSGDLEFETSDVGILYRRLALRHNGDAEFSGAVKIGDTGNVLGSIDEGMLKYVIGTGYEYWDGGAWQTLGITGGTNGLNVNGSNIELGGSLITNTEIVSSGFDFSFKRGSPTNLPTLNVYNDNGGLGTGGSIDFQGLNDATNPALLGKIETKMRTITAGSEDSELVLSVVSAGTFTNALILDGVNDVVSLGAGYNLNVPGTTTTSNLDVSTTLRVSGALVNTPPGAPVSGIIAPDNRLIRVDADITAINSGQEGQEIILMIEPGGAVTINDGVFLQTGSAAGDVIANPFSTIHLIYFSGQWVEMTRSLK